MFSCLIFISTQHYRARRHKLDIWALPDYEHFRNASPLLSSLSLSTLLLLYHQITPSPPPPPPPLPPPSASPSRRTRTAPRTPSLASHTPADSPEEGFSEQIFNDPRTLKSCAAMELAGELGLGSLSRDWMLVRMADTS